MNTVTIPKKEYQDIASRQIFLEKEVAILKRVVLKSEEDFIEPAALRRWEKISRAMDGGGGRSFASAKEMKRWLKEL